ncbi:uncharacterized protein LOC142228076 isoform X2 [Haematobia irritans]|uniref:uncharacterized protein LOC142228076 isoform X2 n=1 Tax=Haematobia irritans TaxID=7368 RepID=UPI003F502F47
MKYIMFKVSVIFILLICLCIIGSQCDTSAEDNVQSPQLLKRLKRHSPHTIIRNCRKLRHDGTCVQRNPIRLDAGRKTAKPYEGSKVVNGEKTLWGKLKSWIGLE